jgi:protein-L-isoaspartate(D-aspartate) O-methyltransferase
MERFMNDPEHERLRNKLVNGIREKGITDLNVLQAINTIPRHLFMTEELQDKAYVDKAFPIGEGQTISQPYTVAYQTWLLQVMPGDKVLEIGTGSGYQASVLAEMGAEVYTIERQKKLYEKNLYFDYLRHFNNIHFFYGDGYEGLPQHAPFDRILITAAAPEIPQKLVHQLVPGGIMVLPLGVAPVQQMVRIKKDIAGQLHKEYFDNFSFVPMLQGKKE